MLQLHLKKILKEYSLKNLPYESCGFLIQKPGEFLLDFFPCKNLSYHKETHCITSPLDYVEAEKQGKIIAHFHSQENELPSIMDNFMAFNFNLYSIIYSWKLDTFYIVKPELKTYLNKDFKIGENDCFSLVRNYYKEELNINISDYSREEDWYLKTPYIILENFEKEGFKKIEEVDFKIHDIFVFGKNKNEVSHLSIYQGNNLILHHPRDSRSCIEDLNTHYLNKLQFILRHKSLL